jgi:hypothetical protein
MSPPARLDTKAEAYFEEHLGETAVAILTDVHYDTDAALSRANGRSSGPALRLLIQLRPHIFADASLTLHLQSRCKL